MRASILLVVALTLAACTPASRREPQMAMVKRAQFQDSVFVRKNCLAAEEVLAGKRPCELID